MGDRFAHLVQTAIINLLNPVALIFTDGLCEETPLQPSSIHCGLECAIGMDNCTFKNAQIW